MKVAKKILIGLLVLIVVLVGTAIAIPFLFKDKLLAVVKEEINNNINAKVDFKDVSLSLFKSFPQLHFELLDYAVTGVAPFEGLTLASGKSAGFSVDLMSVINGANPVKIKSVTLDAPQINVLILEDGRANYDIAKPTDETEPEAAAEPSNLEVNLKSYSITDGKVVYDDKQGGNYLEINDLDHSGSGNFTLDVYDLDTETEIAELTVSQGAITFLKKAHLTLDAIFNIDQANSKYTLKDNQLKINELIVNADGYVQMEEEDINMDLKFSTPQNEFKQLLSLIPNAYIQGYENVKAEGKFELAGLATGTYNGDQEVYPAFSLHLAVNNANVKYPDLPLGISGINALVDIDSPTSEFDDMTINSPRFDLRIGKNPIASKFHLRTPISDPEVDAKVDGVLNLGELAQAFPMEGIDQLSGIIKANVEAMTRMSYIDQQAYEKVKMDGYAEVTNLKYRSAGLPAVQIHSAKAAFSPQNVRLDQFNAQLGKSDIQAKGRIDNILAYFSPKKTMTGQLQASSKYFDANEWLEEEPVSSPTPAAPALGSSTEEGAAAELERPFDRFDFVMDAQAGEIVYDVYRIKNAAVKGRIKPNRMEVENMSAQIGDSDFKVNGLITNAFDYLFDNGTLGGDINLSSNLLNLNQFMTEEPASVSTTTAPATTPEALEPIVVPANIDMKINARVKKIIYTNMELSDLNGALAIADQSVVLEETTANTLGGKIGIAGLYGGKDPENPDFNVKFDLAKMDFQKAFNTFNSFQKLAPIGKFIEGNFTTSLIMDGKLGKDLMPQYNTLNAEGFLETLNGIVQGFKPLQAVGEALNVKELKENLKVVNTKNWFEIKNGAVELKEFDYKVKDIAMKIGGRHSISQDMEYKIKARIPRKLLEQGAAGAAANSALSALQGQASKLGVNLKQSEFVNVLVNLTGSISSPKVKFQLLGGDGETTATEAAKEEVKEQVNKQIEEGKKMATEKANKAVDTVKTVVNKEVEKAKEDLTKKAKDAAKDKIGTVLDSTAQKKVDDVIDNVGKEGADKIKENLDKFNPFKKKKKDGGK